MTDQNPAPEVPGAVDARFTMAAERTMLAWLRTSLGLIAAGVAVLHVIGDFGTSGAQTSLGIALIVLGAGTALTGAWRWQKVTHTLKHGGEMPGPAPVWAITIAMVIVAGAFVAFA